MVYCYIHDRLYDSDWETDGCSWCLEGEGAFDINQMMWKHGHGE